MTYEELFNKALQGRSINKCAKDWGMPQKTLEQYYKGRPPDLQTAFHIQRDSGLPAEKVLKILAEYEAAKKPRATAKQIGFAVASLLVSVNLFLTPTPSKAAPPLKVTHGQSLYYVKLRLRETMRRITGWLLLKALHALRNYGTAATPTAH